MHGREGAPYVPVEWEAADGEDFADLDYYVADEEYLHFPAIRSVECGHCRGARDPQTYLRPTAAFFRSDLHSNVAETSMAVKAINIEPAQMSMPCPFAIAPPLAHTQVR